MLHFWSILLCPGFTAEHPMAFPKLPHNIKALLKKIANKNADIIYKSIYLLCIYNNILRIFYFILIKSIKDQKKNFYKELLKLLVIKDQ